MPFSAYFTAICLSLYGVGHLHPWTWGFGVTQAGSYTSDQMGGWEEGQIMVWKEGEPVWAANEHICVHGWLCTFLLNEVSIVIQIWQVRRWSLQKFNWWLWCWYMAELGLRFSSTHLQRYRDHINWELETVVIKWLMISPRPHLFCCACRAPEDPSWPTAHLWLSARPLTHGDPGLDSNVTIRSVGFIHHLDLQICFILPQKCSPKWIHPSEICVISLFMMAKEGLTREMEGRGGGEINLMLGFNYWVANLISDSLSC